MSPGARLGALVRERGLVEAMACHSPLSAKLAIEAGYEALWASGFELSALNGLADAALVGQESFIELTRRVVERTGGLVVADIDTGFGNAVNTAYAVETYARAGAAAVVIEDKLFPKMTSLLPGGRQELIRSEEYAGKIGAALEARGDSGMLIIARTEALIAEAGLDEALRRGRAYAEAGADMLLVHSRARDGAEAETFIARWDGAIPLVIVPTAFPSWGVAEARASGKVGMVIWGNHALRASVAAMRETFAAMRTAGSAAGVEGKIATLADIFDLQDMDRVRALESRYLR